MTLWANSDRLHCEKQNVFSESPGLCGTSQTLVHGRAIVAQHVTPLGEGSNGQLRFIPSPRQSVPRRSAQRKRHIENHAAGRDALTLNVVFKLIDDEFLFGNYEFEQIADGDDADYFCAVEHRQMTHALVGHQGHA